MPTLAQTVMNLISKIFLAFSLTHCLLSFSQKGSGKTYAECEGTINIFKSRTFDLQFIGKRGKSQRFAQYPALKHLVSGNQIWFSFIAPTDGSISLDLESKSVGLGLIVFDAQGNDVCTEISRGNAEIVRMVLPQKSTKIGLSESVTDSFLYPVSIKEGKVLHFVVIADEDINENVKLEFAFHSYEQSFTEYKTKHLDFKQDDFAPSLTIKVRDKTNGNPLISSIRLKGMKNYEGVYQASDLVFDLTRNGKLDFSCELEGYFFRDSVGIPISFNQEREIVIELEPVRSGKTVQLEDIEFIPGTSEITQNSLPKLKRLKDFLALNSMVHIEVQGHVFEVGGENSLAGQKMSEARAKRVMKYLVDNGISKDRITPVGYGSTRPIFPAPRHYYEEQANRRVEVVVK